MYEPLVSVIIPAYNAERYIEATLRSVLAQTYTNLEILVIDDGSTDDTRDIIAAVAEMDARVRPLFQQNEGVAAARNLGIRESTGEFIAPIDADDLWSPHKIEKQVECLVAAGPSTGLAYCWTVGINEAGHLIYFGGRPRHEGHVLAQHLRKNFLGNASVPLFRREAVEKVGGYRKELKDRGGQGCEDWDLSLRIAENFEFCVVPEFLTGYRMVTGSMSTQHDVMWRSYDVMIDDLRQRRDDLSRRDYRSSKSTFLLYLVRFRLRSRRLLYAVTGVGQAFLLDPSVVFEQVSTAAYNRAARLYFRMFGLNRSISLPFEQDIAPMATEAPLTVVVEK